MSLLYKVTYYLGRIVFSQTMRTHTINARTLQREGGYVLAVSHVSHLEVAVAGVMTPRQIRWITRKEFYVNAFTTWLLNAMGCIKVNRQGIPVSAIRSAISLARSGEVVGIFPEGGVVWGNDLAMRGGPVKRGMCSIALHAGVPIVPCVILGTEKLNAVKPWLPMWRGKLWVAVGAPICPSPGQCSTRATRSQLADKVRQEFAQLYQQLQQRFGVHDDDVP